MFEIHHSGRGPSILCAAPLKQVADQTCNLIQSYYVVAVACLFDLLVCFVFDMRFIEIRVVK